MSQKVWRGLLALPLPSYQLVRQLSLFLFSIQVFKIFSLVTFRTSVPYELRSVMAGIEQQRRIGDAEMNLTYLAPKTD
jgi:hypothetical protein